METRDIFEQMAARYDNEERAAMAEIIAGAIRQELPGASDTQGKKALDYGCGTGLVGLKLVDLFGSMLFVDTSPQMVEQVRKKLADEGIANASAQSGDFCDFVPPGVSADYIFLSQVLLHVKEYPLLLEKLYDLLHPGGHLIIVDFDKNDNVSSDMVHNGFVQADLADLLRKIGFSSVNSHTFHHGQKLFMNQDASMFLLHSTK